MRIERRRLSPEQSRRLDDEIAATTVAKKVSGRVCGRACDKTCARCGSSTCQCACAPNCPDAPRHLSSHPDGFPIERGITPLVYELRRLGMFQPCWSCEGHLDNNGKLWKVPRVWFYCDSLIAVRLLADAIAKIRATERLSVAWRVVVDFSDPDNPDTTFSLEPALQVSDTPDLPALQKDAAKIAGSLEPLLSELAQRLLKRGGLRRGGLRQGGS